MSGNITYVYPGTFAPISEGTPILYCPFIQETGDVSCECQKDKCAVWSQLTLQCSFRGLAHIDDISRAVQDLHSTLSIIAKRTNSKI